MMPLELLPNHLGGRWQMGAAESAALIDPVRGSALVGIGASGLDLQDGFTHAREQGGTSLRALTHRQRAALLGAAVKVLKINRDAYFEIAMANCGTVKTDSAMDIDGAIFTLNYYAKLGDELGDGRLLLDGTTAQLGKDPSFQSQHVLLPIRGVALLINAFNFPAWSLWEKAAPSLLSGVPVIVKPASATAWLAQRMVADVVAAGVFPRGALSIICGESAGLLDALQPFDVVSFTGSSDTAAVIRSHRAVVTRSVRVNIEADSLNSAVLLPGTRSGDLAFTAFVRDVVREATVKSGQKCTAIRRVFVPTELYTAAAEAISSEFSGITVGDPRNDRVRMGALVSRTQLGAVRLGLDLLRPQTSLIHDGSGHVLIDADPEVAACIGPTLLGATEPDDADSVHEHEIFGPVVTLMPYRSLAQAFALVRRGQGSLVTSVHGADPAALAASAIELAATNGRVHVVSPDVISSHTGHGNVMPMSIHGGPGRAGGGEELGGLRALGFYHRRAAVQASQSVLCALSSGENHAT
jgi:3,4-dehydroadipyl-CoA semialdehyde dehydrogenase